MDGDDVATACTKGYIDDQVTRCSIDGSALLELPDRRPLRECEALISESSTTPASVKAPAEHKRESDDRSEDDVDDMGEISYGDFRELIRLKFRYRDRKDALQSYLQYADFNSGKYHSII